MGFAFETFKIIGTHLALTFMAGNCTDLARSIMERDDTQGFSKCARDQVAWVTMEILVTNDNPCCFFCCIVPCGIQCNLTFRGYDGTSIWLESDWSAKICLIYLGTLLSRRILTSAPVSISAWIFA